MKEKKDRNAKIMALYYANWSYRRIAETFKVHWTRVWYIVQRELKKK